MTNATVDLGNKPKKEPKEILTCYVVLAIDNMDRVTTVSPLYTKKFRMTQDYHKRKAAGESHLLKARVHLTIEEIFQENK